MSELQTIKNALIKKYQNQTWPREIKFWPWEELLSEKVTKDNGIILNKFKDSSQTIQRQILKVLTQNNFSKLQSWQLARGEIYVINIPAGKKIKFEFDNNLADSWATLFIIIGRGAQVVFVDNHKKLNQAFGVMSSFVLSGQNSQVDYIIKNKNNGSSFNYQGILKESADINFYIDSQSRVAYNYHSVVVRHLGKNTQGKIFAKYDIKKSAKNYLDFRNQHQSKNSSGDIAVKVLARDKTKTQVDGWIEISKQAFGTDSYLQEDVLLMSKEAYVNAEPNLEILNNDVKASHGATLGFVAENELFYLMTRGFSKSQAQRLIAQGFLNSINNKIKNNKIKDLF